MNLFFYANSKSTVAEQYVQQLLKKEALASLILLSEGSRLNCEQSLKLRNGDVIILFAATEQDFQNLLLMQDKLEEFRIVLVLPNRTTLSVPASHILKPRFISFADRHVSDIEKVIVQMQNPKDTNRYINRSTEESCSQMQLTPQKEEV